MMKLSVFGSCVLAAVLASAPLFAQPEAKGTEPQKEAATVEPLASKEQVALFFRVLTEGRVDAAYDQLLKGTKIAEMPKDVATLKAKTREAIRVFGDINGCDFVSEQTVGSRINGGPHLVRLTYISLGKHLPIRWRFYFYNANSSMSYPAGFGTEPVIVRGTWKLIDIRIDDRLPDLFEEPAPVVAAPAK